MEKMKILGLNSGLNYSTNNQGRLLNIFSTAFQRGRYWLAFPVFVSGIAFLILWNSALVYNMVVRINMNDFGKFYYSTLAFLEGGEMYGPTPATFIQSTTVMAQHLWDLNPPHFHLLLIPLGLLPPEIAFLIWGSVSLAAFTVCLHLIGNELDLNPTRWQSRFAFLGFLAFCGTGALFITGQVSLLLLLPLTLSWIQARKGHWGKAGMNLGLLCSVKPFLLIFLPYFLLKRRFGGAVILSLTVVVTYLFGFLVFGKEIFWQWVNKMSLVDWPWKPMNASILGLLGRAFQENPLYAQVINAPGLTTPLWLILAGGLGIITLAVVKDDTSDRETDRAFALLLITAVLVSPLGWIYYLFFPLGPLTALLRHWWEKEGAVGFSKTSQVKRRRNFLLLSACPGFFFPVQFVSLFQPSPWATILHGSIYFWCTLAIWASLVLDWYISRPNLQIDPLPSNALGSANWQQDYEVAKTTVGRGFIRAD